MANEPEINLNSILEFFALRWRWILLGPLLAFGYNKAFSPFKAEVILTNLCKDKDKDKECAVDFMFWRSLSESLPAIASVWFQSPEFMSVHPGDNRDWMISPKLWSKIVLPQYAFSKEDIKSFPGASESTKSGSTQILALKLSVEATTHEMSLVRLDQLLSFIRDFGTYTRFKDLIDVYKSESVTRVAEISLARGNADIDLSYLKTKSEALERLFAKDADRDSVDQLKVNIGSGDLRYLPLRTQLNATQMMLLDLSEHINRLNDDAVKNEVLTRFVEQAMGVLGTRFGGVSAQELSNRVFKVEEEVRAGLAPENKIGITAIDRVKADLMHSGLGFLLLLPETSRQVIEPRITLKEILVASFAGVFLAMVSFLAMK